MKGVVFIVDLDVWHEGLRNLADIGGDTME
jgi:hypothetical protein